jgi:small subunit ribosomal protein S9
MAGYPQTGVRGTGRRKEAVARVRLVPGKGNIIVNGLTAEAYFGNRPALTGPLKKPLIAAGAENQYNVLVNTSGGGKSGQADAVILGIARALASKTDDLHGTMRKEGLLTRDSRIKERKKYGRKKARKRFQFSKR